MANGKPGNIPAGKLALAPAGKGKSLSDHVYETIRDHIVNLQLEPGQMLYENELAEQLGVSRTPVRAAIRLLESERLVEVLPQRGTRIALISERKVEEARWVRERLEVGAFREVAANGGAGPNRPLRTQLAAIIAEQRKAAESGDLSQFMAQDEAFHRAVMAATGNETLLQVVALMRAHLNRVRYLALRQYHDMARIIEEHEGLLTALESGDEALTASRLESHLGRLGKTSAQLRGTTPHYFSD